MDDSIYYAFVFVILITFAYIINSFQEIILLLRAKPLNNRKVIVHIIFLFIAISFLIYTIFRLIKL